MLLRSIAICCAMVTTVWGSLAAQANFHNYYVGLHTSPLVTFGTYTGLTNPNQGRLTFLYAHVYDDTPEVNHFHGIGAYSYTGPMATPTVLATNANNRLPETFTGQAPLTMIAGSGAFAGKLTSGENGEHYSDLTFASIHELASFAAGTGEHYLYNSSGGGYQGSLTNLSLGLEIVSITPGLKLGEAGLGAGQTLAVGDLSTPFEPVFWTEGNASPGTYSAELRLIDLSGTYLPSGTLNFDFAVVPEPSTMALGGILTLVGLSVVKLRR